ncbi:chemotaxis protein CheX [Magnetofaba australis]|uniref:Putative type IV pilus assembly PilZ n=1 Tax=Magnetofaba australis IT-1 TaxID=1434232 RepID=A0A1Y2K6G6_9PROT|nr:chemotaxis protein CheX [Magnetofaba australis]OSM04031.1 putative type IV pilus assembly PilZ [Magnetofaba australis IT-1]
MEESVDQAEKTTQDLEKRINTRLPLQLPIELRFGSEQSYMGVSRNISFSSVYLEGEAAPDCPMGEECEIVVDCGEGFEPRYVYLVGRFARFAPDGVGLRLIKASSKNYRGFKKLLLSHVDTPKALLGELGRNADNEMTIVHMGFMREEMATHITDAVNEVFIAFLMEELQEGPVVVKPEYDEYAPPEAEVTAVVNFNGAIQGGIHFSTPEHTALSLAGALAGEELEALRHPTTIDALGELANMIGGGVQTRLSEDYENINLTPPTVIVGRDYGVIYQSDLLSVKQYFMTAHGPFLVEGFFSAN